MESLKHNYSVSEISSIFKELFNENIFKNISVYGEVYQIKLGKFSYIDIGDKDKKQGESPVIKCAFSSFSKNFNLDKIQVGDIILVNGSFSYYEKNASITLWASSVELIQSQLGISLIKKQEILKRLEKDGILNREKKVLPKYISKVGIITASGSAAYDDIIKTLKDRFPVNSILFPAVVQGSDGAKSLISALNKAYKSDVEAIIIGRGGGSKSDLSCFDDEELARTIAKSKVPVITCIGHTIDISICDRVSDIHAITPTEGASFINPPLSDVINDIIQGKEQIDYIFNSFIQDKILSLDNYCSRLSDLSPTKYISNLKDRFDNNLIKLNNLYQNILSNESNIINNLKNRFNELYSSKLIDKKTIINNYISVIERYNPKTIKEKGYIQVLKNKKLLKSKKDLVSNDEVELVFLDGLKEAIIK